MTVKTRFLFKRHIFVIAEVNGVFCFWDRFVSIFKSVQSLAIIKFAWSLIVMSVMNEEPVMIKKSL